MAHKILGQSGGGAAITSGTFTTFVVGAIKPLGGDITVTTVGKPVLTSVAVQQGDEVLGRWTSVEFVSGTGTLVLYPA